MTREETLKDYKVENGIITSPGKFEGERVYVLHYWDLFLNGMADEDDGEVLGFMVTLEDAYHYPELREDGYRPFDTIRLFQRDDGFVCRTERRWEDNLLDVQPENEEPIEYTHYDCWPVPDDTEATENASFVKELLAGWAEEYSLPDLKDIADKYGSIGQVETMSLAADAFAKAGWPVYDGEAFFEVYAKPKIES